MELKDRWCRQTECREFGKVDAQLRKGCRVFCGTGAGPAQE